MNYPRQEYEMTEEDLKTLLDAMRPVPMIMLHIGTPRSQQDNANDAWAALGTKMGFDPTTVRPSDGKGNRFFTAIPSENEVQRKEREDHEHAKAKEDRIAVLTKTIDDASDELHKLRMN